MWGWITAILKALLPFLWDKAEQPSTLTDEKIPKSLSDSVNADARAKLDELQREQGGNPENWNPPNRP